MKSRLVVHWLWQELHPTTITSVLSLQTRSEKPSVSQMVQWPETRGEFVLAWHICGLPLKPHQPGGWNETNSSSTFHFNIKVTAHFYVKLITHALSQEVNKSTNLRYPVAGFCRTSAMTLDNSILSNLQFFFSSIWSCRVNERECSSKWSLLATYYNTQVQQLYFRE